jgi:hypothetical protein
MRNVEACANRYADEVLSPLQLSSAVGPVLATPAYAAYGTGVAVAFTLGLISDAVHHGDGDEVSTTDQVPTGASAGQLVEARLNGIK